MFKKIRLTLFFCIVLTVNYALADASSELEQAKALVIDYITSGKDAEAADAYQELIVDFESDANLAGAVFDIAEQYRHSQKFQSSIDTYKYILDNHPGSERAIWAQTFTAVDYVALSDMQKAQAETEKLLQQYDDDPNLAAAVTEIGGAYHWFKKYSQADAINELVLEKWPDSQPALWARMNLITSKIAIGELSEASAEIEQFLIKHSDDGRLPEALSYIAGSFEYVKRYYEAKAIFQQIAEQFPASSQAGEVSFAIARMGVLSAIDTNEPSSLQVVDVLAANFKEYPALPGTLVHTIAHRIYNKAFEMEAAGLENQSKAYFQKAVDIWEQVGASHPEQTNTADGYNWAGNCYRELGEYGKAIACYSNVAEKFPEHSLAWNALFLVGRCYEDMQRAEAIGELEAKSKIRAAYQKLIEKYPDCQAAEIAKSWLDENNEGTETSQYYEE